MYICSQDKRTIINSDNCKCIRVYPEFDIKVDFVGGGISTIGSYLNYERCMSILDDLMRSLKDEGVQGSLISTIIRLHPVNDNIYYMPQE